VSDYTPPAIAKANLTTGGPLAALVPQNLDDAFRLSKALSLSGDMVPKHFQGKPEMIMAAIARGMEIGLAPMQALSNIAVINGRASIWGDALPALLQRAGHSINCTLEGEGDARRAVATVKRGDSGETIVREFSVADAKKAGLWGKAGPWQSYPDRMLQMRARSYAARDGAADALMGLQVAEEVQDYPKDVTPKEAGAFTQIAQAARARTMPEPIEHEAETVEEAPTEEAHWTDAPPPDFFPGTPAFTEGVNAAKDGIPARECPYEQGTEQAHDWLGGWRGAQKASE
jgi:ribosome modulation factor